MFPLGTGSWCARACGNAVFGRFDETTNKQLVRDVHRLFTSLAAGCNTGDYATVAPPATNMYTYDMAVSNSCTDTYM